jgi:hypothetical protein
MIQMAVGQENEVKGKGLESLQAGQGIPANLLRVDARINDDVQGIKLQQEAVGPDTTRVVQVG